MIGRIISFIDGVSSSILNQTSYVLYVVLKRARGIFDESSKDDEDRISDEPRSLTRKPRCIHRRFIRPFFLSFFLLSCERSRPKNFLGRESKDNDVLYLDDKNIFLSRTTNAFPKKCILEGKNNASFSKRSFLFPFDQQVQVYLLYSLNATKLNVTR